MTRNEFTDRLNYCRRELEALQSVAMNCTRCLNYQPHNSNCIKHGPVPADFIQQGCDDWFFDDVPF